MLSQSPFLKDEIEILYAASNKLTQASTPAESLEAVSDYARDNDAATGLLLYTDNPTNPEWFEVVAIWTRTQGIPLTLGTQTPIPRELLGRMVGAPADRPILFQDVTLIETIDEDTRQRFANLQMRAVAGLPLTIKDRWVGMVIFGWTAAHLFDEHDQRILTALIQQASPVIDSMRLFDQMQRRALDLEVAMQEIDMLYSASNHLTRAQTPDELLEAVSVYARGSGAVSGALLYLDGSGDKPEQMVTVAEWFPDAVPSRVGMVYDLSEHEINRVWLENPVRPTLIEDTYSDPRIDSVTREFYDSLHIRATVILPLNNRGRWVGLIVFNWHEPRKFSLRDVRIYTAMIQQAAPAIDALRLLDQSRERADRAELLLEINTALSQATDEAAILNAIALYTECQLAAGLTLNYLDLDEEGNPAQSVPVAVWRGGSASLYNANEHYIVPLSKFGIATLWVNQPEQVLLIEDIATYPWINENARAEMLAGMNTRAMAILPLHTGGRYQGVISILWFEPHHFTDQEKYVYNVLMQTVPSVVATRRAYLAEEAARKETELLYQASEVINAATTFEELAGAVALLDISLRGIVLSVWENFDFDTASYFEAIATAKGSTTRLGERFSVDNFPIFRNMPRKGLWISEDIANDPRIDPVSVRNWLERDTAARIAVALSINNRWMGTLAFQSDSPRVYTARDRRLVMGIGDLMSAALERIRLQSETEAARQRAETLAQVNAALSQATDEWEILAAVGLYTRQISPTNMSLNYFETGRCEPTTMTIMATWENNEPAPWSYFLNQTYEVTQFETTPLWIDAPDEPLMIEDVMSDPRLNGPLRQFMAELGHHALLIIPLFSSGCWQGMIGCTWEAPRRFDANDRHICQSLIQTVGAIVASRQSYLAAERARRENEQRARELETVANVSAAAATLLSETELLQTVSELTQTNFNLYHAQVFLLDSVGDSLLLALPPGKLDQVISMDMREIRLDDERSIVAEVGRIRQGVILNDVFERGDFPFSARLPETRSELAVPMVVGDRLIGVLDIHSRDTNHFTQADIRIMSTLADQVAVAVQNARLYSQAQELAILEERNRLARELHDSVSQALYGIALGTRTARSLLERDPSMVAEPLEYVLSLAEAGLTEMRALIFELRPEALKNEGLIAALIKQAASLQARHGIEVQTQLCIEPEVALDIKEALYHIAREAMHNTVKHARATEVILCLEATPTELVLDLHDNGIGFDTSGSFPGHLGLQSMRERAMRLRGSFKITSVPGTGTHIQVRIPTG